MDWQAAATQLLNLVLTARSFEPGFDFEQAWPSLLVEFRAAINTDARAEAERLRSELAQRDRVFAAEQRMLALGASAEDIALLGGRQWKP